MRNLGLFVLISCLATQAGADDMVTRAYQLKNVEVANLIPVLNFCVKDTSQKRIVAGDGKKLVVTDLMEHQEEIAELLPVLDQPVTATEPPKIQMEMLVRASHFLQDRKKAEHASKSSRGASSVTAASPAGKANSYDVRTSTKAYKSVYSDEDAVLTRKPRVIRDEPMVGSLGGLILKGIYKDNRKTPLALLTYSGVNYTARDGGLFAANRDRVKGVSTVVKKDSVMVTGPDRIPHEIRFFSSLTPEETR